MKMLNKHPFNQLHSRDQIITLFPHFLGISLAFPYIQAGSQLSLILDSIKSNHDIPSHVEMTSVVGNFLCWDETGGQYIIERFGKAGLQNILDTKKWFHSNLLRHDIETLTGKAVTPDFSEPTRSYLLSLIDGLSNRDAVIRCAYMVAFEMHAHTIIESLWAGIRRNFNHNSNELIYFKTHVGEDDPAEAYHIEMVHKMLELVVGKEEEDKFQHHAMTALYESLNWSASISKVSGWRNLEH
ncbi:hypothetical protein [Legionella gresilensis]|nr:hypothetical protein [Legionella gresilensis]